MLVNGNSKIYFFNSLSAHDFSYNWWIRKEEEEAVVVKIWNSIFTLKAPSWLEGYWWSVNVRKFIAEKGVFYDPNCWPFEDIFGFICNVCMYVCIKLKYRIIFFSYPPCIYHINNNPPPKKFTSKNKNVQCTIAQDIINIQRINFHNLFCKFGMLSFITLQSAMHPPASIWWMISNNQIHTS